MKNFLANNLTSQDTGTHLARSSGGGFLQGARNAVMALVLAQGAQADELTLPIGVSIVHADPEQADLIGQRVKMCHELGESPAGQKVLFVMTDTPQTINVRAGEEFPVYFYGDQERFFARLNPQHVAEISTDLNNWEPCRDEDRVPVIRENPETVANLQFTLQSLSDLTRQEETLVNTLSAEVGNLQQIEISLNASTEELMQVDEQRDGVALLTDQKMGQQEMLEVVMNAEGQLREDTHPVVSNTNLSDSTKMSETQEALDNYHELLTNGELVGFSAPESGMSIIPNLSDVNLTISYLVQELARIQSSIDTVNSQITTKQNDINNTQNTIQTLQNSINQLTTQITQYANNYTYWRDEYNRIINLITTYNAEVTTQSSNYSNSRTALVNAGRNDVPSDIAASDIATRLINLKSTILNEYNSVPYTANTGSTGTEYNLPDETSSVRDYMGSQYYYVVDFPSSGRSWPATLRLHVKLLGAASFTNVDSHTVQNRNHSVAMFNGTAKPQAEKLAQYKYVDDVLETYYELYKAAQNNAAQQYGPRDTARVNRDSAKSQLDIAYALNDQKQVEMTSLQSQQTLLAQQKADLENLKSIKTNLQNLYNEVQTILNNLKNNIVTHGQVTTQIESLLSQFAILEQQVAALIQVVEGKIIQTNAQINKVAGITATLTDTTTEIGTLSSISTAVLERNKIVKPRDGINSSPLNYNQIAEYFSYAYRTSMGPISASQLPTRAIVQHLDNGVKEDLYPARLSYEYKINGKVYFTPQLQINNLEHKGVVAELCKVALFQLESCLGERGKGTDTNDGMKKMWEMVKKKILALPESTDDNADIREYQKFQNEIIESVIISGTSQAFFDYLLLHEAGFSGRIDSFMSAVAQNQGIVLGTDEYEKMRRTLIHILAQDFGNSLIESEFAGLNSYTNYRLSAESHIAMVTNSLSANDVIIDINDTWNTDEHGNKYKYGVCSLDGDGGYPKSVWMSYSPDGISVQTVGPVSVLSSSELAEQKETWRKNLLHSKKSHTNYSGGAYDIFQGWGEAGEKVWWGQYLYGSMTQGTSFDESSSLLEKEMRDIIKSSSDMAVRYDFVKYVYKGNLSFSLIQSIHARGETVEQFIRQHDATDKMNGLIQRLENDLSFGDIEEFQALVGNGGACDVKRNSNFENVSFIDPENNESSVFINGTIVSRAQLGNFLVGYGGREVGLTFPLVCAGSLYKQIETYTSNKTGYGLQRLNREHIFQLAELNEKEDRFLYLSGYSYNGAGAGEKIEAYIEYMRKLSMQQAVEGSAEIHRIKSLNDF